MERDPPGTNEAVDFGPASPWSRPPVRRPAATPEAGSRSESGVVAARAPADALARSARRSFGGLRQITVANPLPGAGKTVATLLLSLMFGQIRGGLVLAWDNNVGYDNSVGHNQAMGALAARAPHGAGFDVFAWDDAATAGRPLAARTFRDTREAVAGRYGLIVVDTGCDAHALSWRAAIDATDQLVIPVRAGDASGDSVERLLDHLDQAGRRELVRRAVVVVTMPPQLAGSQPVDSQPGWIERFEPRCRVVLRVPYDRHLDSTAPVRYDALSPDSRRAWLRVTAGVVDGL